MEEIRIFMDDGKIVSYPESKYTLSFNGEWVLVKGGYNFSHVVFAASARKVRLIKVS